MRTGPKLKRATLRQAVMVPLRVTLTHFYHSYNSVFNGGTGGARTHENLLHAMQALSQLSYNPKLSALRRSASRGY